MLTIERSYLTEILVTTAPGAGVKYMFPSSLGDLNNETFYAFEAYSSSEINATPLTYATPVPISGYRSAMLVLLNDVDERVRQMPLINLIPQQNGGIQREFKPFKMNLAKCYIQLNSATGVTAAQGFVLNLIYKG